MNGDQVPRRLAAALRAQASGLGTGPSTGSVPDARQVPGHPPARGWRGLPVWGVLALVVLLGALAGGLAGVISVW
ncbi:MAG TPA: hypothetical protein VHH53_06490 [Pseudonocardiaceae bacterium]|nr:hypothetical protein [Pseudonocardiaceae bacterium]